MGPGAGSSQTEHNKYGSVLQDLLLGNCIPRQWGPWQGRHKLNTTNTLQFYSIHYWETAPPDNGSGAGSSQTEHTQIKFSFIGFITRKPHPQGVGSRQGHKLNTTKTVQFYRIHYWETESPGSGSGAGLLQTEHNKYSSEHNKQVQFSFTGFITRKLHPQVVGPPRAGFLLTEHNKYTSVLQDSLLGNCIPR